jgi:GntR family transcriptional repressor for pyruvate dehydrogenase complex
MPRRERAGIGLFTPVVTGRAVSAVVDQIVDLICSGRLRDGELLPGERQLAEAMSVSRRTLREASEVLQDAGVITVAPGPAGGARVASVWIPDGLTRAPDPVSAARVPMILEARRAIEPRVAQLAALRGSDEDFAIMRETIELQRAHQDDRLKVVQGNTLFHRQLWRAACNDELAQAMRSIYRHLSHAFYEALARDRESASTGIGIELHEETLAAVMHGDPARIDEVMDRHLAYLERRCQEAFGVVPYGVTGAT